MLGLPFSAYNKKVFFFVSHIHRTIGHHPSSSLYLSQLQHATYSKKHKVESNNGDQRIGSSLASRKRSRKKKAAPFLESPKPEVELLASIDDDSPVDEFNQFLAQGQHYEASRQAFQVLFRENPNLLCPKVKSLSAFLPPRLLLADTRH